MSITGEHHWKQLKTGWLITAGLIAVYLAAIQPLQRFRSVTLQKGTGLGAVAEWQSNSLSQQHAPYDLLVSREQDLATRPINGIVGGVPGRAPADASSIQLAGLASFVPAPALARDSDDRRLVRTDSMELIVRNPSNSVEKVRQLAENAGGFLVSSQVSGGQDATAGSLTIRVPAARFEEVRTEIRKLGIRLESDRVAAQDVTRQYVDQQARLRNLQAQESQYLLILKKASTVKDTLDVSEKLDAVRGEIEQQQAEFEALSRQVETVAITVQFRAQADAQVFGLNWRPLYHVKSALRDGLDGVADYAATMASVIFYLPTILLWLVTILLSAAIGWRILRWAARMLFVSPKTVVSPIEAN
jgi:Domain of unknown function (DUF4349)